MVPAIHWLYTALFYLAIPGLLVRLAWRGRRVPGYRQRWAERFGLYRTARDPRPLVWFHAVSVGETEAASPLIQAFRKARPDLAILLTTSTPTGSGRAVGLFGDSIEHVYLPYDLPDAMARFLCRFQPLIGVILETEVWPNLLSEARNRKLPVCIVNGRVSDRSFRGYGRIAAFTRDCLGKLACVCAQTQLDAARFVALGAPGSAVVAMGNVKFDITLEPDLEANAQSFRKALFNERPVVIAGSTHAGEEEAILSAYSELRSSFPNLALILAPRHPERAGEVGQLCGKSGFSFSFRSQGGGPSRAEVNVYILDSIGELRDFYATADIAFVGGSLVPIGGHNVLEPAALGVPVAFGPHMSNFREVARTLCHAGAGIQIESIDQFGVWARTLLNDPNKRKEIGIRGREFVTANRGATQNIVRQLCVLLGDPGLASSDSNPGPVHQLCDNA